VKPGAPLAGILAGVLAIALGCGVLSPSKPAYSGTAAGRVTLRAPDLTGQSEGSVLVERFERLGVHAAIVDAQRDRTVLDISGASDVRTAATAVIQPCKLAIYRESPLTGAGDEAGPDAIRTRLLSSCASAPCDPIRVDLPAALANRDLANARMETGSSSGTQLQLDLTPDGALQLEALTQRQVGHRIVVAIDDRIYAAPSVQERSIQGGVAFPVGNSAAGAAERAAGEALTACLNGKPLTGRWEIERVELRESED
jgi:preprotein translocase subunit SecD